jgi:DNA-binding NarL/FixJ family response regulator
MCQTVKFKSKAEQRIMELYCEGKTDKEIGLEVKKDRWAISDIIDKYLILFGLYGK